MTIREIPTSGPYKGIPYTSTDTRMSGDMHQSEVVYDCGCVIRSTWKITPHGEMAIGDAMWRTVWCPVHQPRVEALP